MAVLTATSRARTVAQWKRENRDTCGFTSVQLAAALDAADDWVEANTASYVAALPAAFRTNSTAAQKTDLLLYVLLRRMGRLRAEED